MASFLDTNAAQLVSSSSGLGDASANMRGTIAQAEANAQAAMGFHMGESSTAFQAAHARFVEAASKTNMLLDVAAAQVHEGAGSYVTGDSEMADGVSSASGIIPT